MKRLLIILHDLSAGGAEKMMARLAGALVDAGNDVTLLMLTGGGVNVALVDPRVKQVELRSARSASAVPALASFLRQNHFDAQLAALTHVNVVAIAAAALSGTLARLHVSPFISVTIGWVCGSHLATMEPASSLSPSFTEITAPYGSL